MNKREEYIKDILELKLHHFGDRYINVKEAIKFFPEDFQNELHNLKNKNISSGIDVIIMMFSLFDGIETEEKVDELFEAAIKRYLESLPEFKLKEIIDKFIDV